MTVVGRASSAVTGILGAVIGLVVGIAIDGGVWLVTFGRALNGSVGAGVPLIVTTSLEGGEVTASSGVGILVVPVASAVIGCLVGIVGSRTSGRRRRHRM